VTTVDLSLGTGAEIHIEQRPPVEATLVRGKNLETGQLSVVRITPEGVGAVLPGDRITGHVQGVGEIALTVGQPD
jgi:methylthioribose-1-phosphate isomerase